jgi:glycosyltransferase involved in cell wall biosynthesis
MGLSALRVYVLTPAFVPDVGGQEIQVHELCTGLIAQGVDVLVITRRYQTAHAALEVAGTVPVVRLTPLGDTKGAGWHAIPKLMMFLLKVSWRLICDRRRYDLVLVSGFNILPSVAVVVGTLSGKPCIVRPESPMELQHPISVESRRKMGLREDSLLLRLVGWSRQAMARRVDRYVAISEEIRTGLVEQGVDPTRIVSIPNGINVEKFAPVTPERRRELRHYLGLPGHGRILVYTGRLAVSKGIMMLAGVWRDLYPELPDTYLLLVGAGLGSIDDCEQELRRFLAANMLTDRTILSGEVANVNEYLQASDIFVFPSDYEGFGLSILEAMAVGLPLVSTRVGVAADLAQRYQPEFLVDPRQPMQFSDALRRLLSDPHRQQAIAARGLREVQTQYSMAAVAHRYVGLMNRVVRGAPEPADGGES